LGLIFGTAAVFGCCCVIVGLIARRRRIMAQRVREQQQQEEMKTLTEHAVPMFYPQMQMASPSPMMNGSTPMPQVSMTAAPQYAPTMVPNYSNNFMYSYYPQPNPYGMPDYSQNVQLPSYLPQPAPIVKQENQPGN